VRNIIEHYFGVECGLITVTVVCGFGDQRVTSVVLTCASSAAFVGIICCFVILYVEYRLCKAAGEYKICIIYAVYYHFGLFYGGANPTSAGPYCEI